MVLNVIGYERKNDGLDWDLNLLDFLYFYIGVLLIELFGVGYLN